MFLLGVLISLLAAAALFSPYSHCMVNKKVVLLPVVHLMVIKLSMESYIDTKIDEIMRNEPT